MQPSLFKDELANLLVAACRQIGLSLVIDGLTVLERPRHPSHGDFCCPLALALASQTSTNPRQLAEKIVSALTLPDWVAETTIAGPGFINIILKNDAKISVIDEILSSGNDYGRQAAGMKSVLLEFVSANPTGPLHVGHGRACAYGDSLANILIFSGYRVEREYYVNSAGRQMDILAASVWLRYWLGRMDKTTMPAGSYRGDYLIAVAHALTNLLDKMAPPPETLFSDETAGKSDDMVADALVLAARQACSSTEWFSTLTARVCQIMLDSVIKEDMRAIKIDVGNINFFSEITLHTSGQVAETIKVLNEHGYLYEKDGALWFKSTADGDEKDRVVRRSNGELTYFAADIAYHADKLNRDLTDNDYQLINVLGADHHGYVPRLRAAMSALGYAPERLETQLIQFVSLLDGGKRLKMSTRAAEFVTLRQLIDRIGADAARYFYVNRQNDQHLDFDLTTATARNQSNPVYYIQYANARICSVLRKWGGDESTLIGVAWETLSADSPAIDVSYQLMLYPDTIQRAATERAPHLLATYLYDLAVALHTYYDKQRILPMTGEAVDDEKISARLQLLLAVRFVLNNGMNLLGVSLPEEM